MSVIEEFEDSSNDDSACNSDDEVPSLLQSQRETYDNSRNVPNLTSRVFSNRDFSNFNSTIGEPVSSLLRAEFSRRSEGYNQQVDFF